MALTTTHSTNVFPVKEKQPNRTDNSLDVQGSKQSHEYVRWDEAIQSIAHDMQHPEEEERQTCVLHNVAMATGHKKMDAFGDIQTNRGFQAF